MTERNPEDLFLSLEDGLMSATSSVSMTAHENMKVQGVEMLQGGIAGIAPFSW